MKQSEEIKKNIEPLQGDTKPGKYEKEKEKECEMPAEIEELANGIKSLVRKLRRTIAFDVVTSSLTRKTIVDYMIFFIDYLDSEAGGYLADRYEKEWNQLTTRDQYALLLNFNNIMASYFLPDYDFFLLYCTSLDTCFDQLEINMKLKASIMSYGLIELYQLVDIMSRSSNDFTMTKAKSCLLNAFDAELKSFSKAGPLSSWDSFTWKNYLSRINALGNIIDQLPLDDVAFFNLVINEMEKIDYSSSAMAVLASNYLKIETYVAEEIENTRYGTFPAPKNPFDKIKVAMSRVDSDNLSEEEQPFMFPRKLAKQIKQWQQQHPVSQAKQHVLASFIKGYLLSHVNCKEEDYIHRYAVGMRIYKHIHDSDSDFFAYIKKMMPTILAHNHENPEFVELADKYHLVLKAGSVQFITFLCAGLFLTNSPLFAIGLLLVLAGLTEAYHFGQLLDATPKLELAGLSSIENQISNTNHSFRRTVHWSLYSMSTFADSAMQVVKSKMNSSKDALDSETETNKASEISMNNGATS